MNFFSLFSPSSFLPVLVMNLILLVVTLLIILADRFLLSYGNCGVSVVKEGETKRLQVMGGQTLLDALIAHGIPVTASCGGRATCGFCKVRVKSGGGAILPTEEIFMSRPEKESGMRLACQVKVREDISIEVPDFLETVRSIVANKTFDARARWKFRIQGRTYPETEASRTSLPPEELAKLGETSARVKTARGNLIPALQETNSRMRFLPEAALEHFSEQLEIPLTSVFRVATFYNAFSLKPRGKHQISVCLGTACHVKGAEKVITQFEQELKIRREETTEDMMFTLKSVRCIGCCGLAPVLTVNEDVHGHISSKQVAQLIKTYRQKEA